jgi:hypothetical protein
MNEKPVEMDPIKWSIAAAGPSPTKSPLGISFLKRSQRNYCNDTCDWDE